MPSDRLQYLRIALAVCLYPFAGVWICIRKVLTPSCLGKRTRNSDARRRRWPSSSYLIHLPGSGGRGAFVQSGSGGDVCQIQFSSLAEFRGLLQAFMTESVSLSIGSHSPGPTDEVVHPVANDELEGQYVEISRRTPDRELYRALTNCT